MLFVICSQIPFLWWKLWCNVLVIDHCSFVNCEVCWRQPMHITKIYIKKFICCFFALLAFWISWRFYITISHCIRWQLLTESKTFNMLIFTIQYYYYSLNFIWSSYKRLCTFAQDMIKENWGFIGAKIGPQLIVSFHHHSFITATFFSKSFTACWGAQISLLQIFGIQLWWCLRKEKKVIMCVSRLSLLY